MIEDVAGSSVRAYLPELEKAPSGLTDTTVVEIDKCMTIGKNYDGRGARVEVLITVTGRTGSPERPRGCWAVSALPLQEIAGARLVLRGRGDVFDDRRSRRGVPKRIARFKAEFTVGEVLTGLLYDICFDGSPETRDQRMKEVHERLKRKGRTYSWAELKAECEAQAKREAPKLARIEERLRRERHPEEKDRPGPAKKKKKKRVRP